MQALVPAVSLVVLLAAALTPGCGSQPAPNADRPDADQTPTAHGQDTDETETAQGPNTDAGAAATDGAAAASTAEAPPAKATPPKRLQIGNRSSPCSTAVLLSR